MLYKKDTTGKIRIWEIEVEDNKYRTTTGVLDGKQITNEWTICEPKNIGRSNETSASEQAQLEAKAKVEKKIKEGYFENINDVDKSTLIKPMLAHKYEKYTDKIKFPVFSQPKLDGIRCNITKDGMFSRKGERITSCPHIFNFLSKVFEESPDTILDGELYNHSYKDNFNEIQSLVTKKNPNEQELQKIKESIQYYVYDVVSNESFMDRFHEAVIFDLKRPDNLSEEVNPIYKVDTVHVGNQVLLDELYELYVANGYEGQMVRTNEPYDHKRSKNLLKRKDFSDDEFEIIGVEEGKGNRSGMAGRITLKTESGKEFGAGIKGGVEYYKKLWKEKDDIIGLQGTVEYFNLTPDGIPRFPVFKAVRYAA